MKRVTLTNDFHHTEAVVIPGPSDTLTSRQVKRAWAKLCGMSECKCGGNAGERGGAYVVDGDRHSGYRLVHWSVFDHRYALDNDSPC